MLAVSVVMYSVSAIHWSFHFAIVIQWLRMEEYLPTFPESMAVVYLPTINVRHSLTA
jgi:hypothetical protein